MEFLDGAATWFRNARIVTADRVFIGCLKVEDGRIDEIGEHESRGAGIDFQGDYLLPGLIELHTDHLESHYFPRRAVTWHAGSAVLIAAAGITTVFDSFRVGVDEFDVGAQLGDEAALLAEAIRRAATQIFCAPTISPICAAKSRRRTSSTPSMLSSLPARRSSSRSWIIHPDSGSTGISRNTSSITPASRDAPEPISQRWPESDRGSAAFGRSKTGPASSRSPKRAASCLPATTTRRRRRSPWPAATG